MKKNHPIPFQYVTVAAIIALLIAGATNCSPAEPPHTSQPEPSEVDVVVDGSVGKSARFGITRLTEALQARGSQTRYMESLQEAESDHILLLGTRESSQSIRRLLAEGNLELSEREESLAVTRQLVDGRNVLIMAGSDDRGLMYAALEAGQQIEAFDEDKNWFFSLQEISESPLVPVRSMAVLLHNEDCEKDWYYSEDYWQEYLGMLAADRWNHFNLIFSHQTPYLSPLYAFHVKVKEHPEVRAIGLTEEQRQKNLDMLRYISALAAERGIDFTLGIWQQIAWEGKHQGSRQESMVRGLSRANMHSYTYLALRTLLEACPDIKTVQLRINHESGIDYDEQTEFFTNSVFRAIQDCGHPVTLEARNVGLLRETIMSAVDMGLPTRVSHKYWGEHQFVPYHPTRIMWTYSYGDWLKYPQKWRNLYQVWSLGSHRLLLWGDPEHVRRFAPTTVFQDADGFEICAPLSQKGYGNSPGAWRIFRDKEREHFRWEFERYWSYYSLFGRLTYNPETSDEIWLRQIRARFGREAAPSIAAAYKAASRVLPLIMGAATPDYNMHTWPEKDSGGLINFYLHYGTFGELRISSLMDYVDDVLRGESNAKLTPEETANRLELTAAECEKFLREAENLIDAPNKEFWATKKDFQILSGMARFFAHKLRATYNLGFYYRLHDLSCLEEAIAHARAGLEIWEGLSAVAEEIYYPDLIMGPGSRGHWKDQLVWIKNDLEQLLYQEELFRILPDFELGFDFGPRAYTNPTEIYTPWYTNNYWVEHRFQGITPDSFFNPQQGYGWNGDFVLEAAQPPKIPRWVWRASNLDNLNIPDQVLLRDFIRGEDEAVFMLDLPEGHYQATLVFTDRSPNPRDHGPMNVAVIERFGERPILEDAIIKKGEMLVKRFNFNMVGSRYSNFRLKLSAEPGADFILNALTFTRIEPHIAHLPLRRALPGQVLEFQATVTLPEQILMPVKNSLSIARGTTSTIEPPDKLVAVRFFYSTNNGRTYQVQEMTGEDVIYSTRVPGDEVKQGEIRYFLEATDSIGQITRLPSRSEPIPYYTIKVNADLDPPEISHKHIEACDPGETLQVDATIKDASAIAKVFLYYRPTRQAQEYTKVIMYPVGNDLFTGTIAGESITTEFDLIYFIEAVDEFGNGIFYPDPDREDPQIVVKVRR